MCILGWGFLSEYFFIKNFFTKVEISLIGRQKYVFTSFTDANLQTTEF